MKYEIVEVRENKKEYLDLLLLGDEQEDMIDRYLDAGRMFVLHDRGVKCAAVVAELNAGECELKNIATYPQYQRRGYGRAMLEFLFDTFLGPYETMFVGTGETPRILKFYRGCGFRPSHRVENFFADNYREPIIEDGVRLVDMVYLRIDARGRGRTRFNKS